MHKELKFIVIFIFSIRIKNPILLFGKESERNQAASQDNLLNNYIHIRCSHKDNAINDNFLIDQYLIN